MTHRSVDGTLVVARLKRRVLGGAVYCDVTIRGAGGGETNLGTMMALDDMRHAMVPGGRGRFYVYDVLGSKGVHGFRPASGKAYANFPRRWAVMCWGAAALNLLIALSWLLFESRFAIWASSFGMLSMVLGVTFLTTRRAAMQAYHADDYRVADQAELRTAAAPV